MQVRVLFLAAIAALTALPVLAQPRDSTRAAAECLRRAPNAGAALQTAPCRALASPDLYPDGLAGGPSSPGSMAAPAYSPPDLAYRARIGGNYDSYPAMDPAPGYGPAATVSSGVQGQASSNYLAWGGAPAYSPPDLPPPAAPLASPQAVYDPNRAPYYAGNILSASQTPPVASYGPTADFAPPYPEPPPPPYDSQCACASPGYAASPPAADYRDDYSASGLYASSSDYAGGYAVPAPPPPAPPPPPPIDYRGGYDAGCACGPGVTGYVGGYGALPAPAGPDYRSQYAAGSQYAYGAANSGYAGAYLVPPTPAPTIDYRGDYSAAGQYAYGASAYQTTPAPPPVNDYRGAYDAAGGCNCGATGLGYAGGTMDYRAGYANSSQTYGASTSSYSAGNQAFLVGGGYTSLPAAAGYAPGQCTATAGANGRVQYQAQSCERSSSQSYAYSSGYGGSYGVAGGQVAPGLPHWGVAGVDPNGFLTWPGKVGY